MSWIDKIKNDLIIVTGDGNTFRPAWMNASKEKEYNIAEFEFPDIKGTLVSRKLSKGRKYSLEIYFQGANCIEDAAAFERSADDPRAWTITHPFYGNITVQPLGLVFDNTMYNVSKVTSMVIETITEGGPRGNVDAVSKIKYDKDQLDKIFAQAYALRLKVPTSSDKTLLTNNVKKVYDLGLPSIKLDIDAENYFNAFNAANSAILNLAADIAANIAFVQALINEPLQFVNSIKIRIQTLVNQFNSLRTAIFNLSATSSPNYNSRTKAGDEHNRGMIISAMAVASVTEMDYITREDVVATVESIVDTYNQYILDLDTFQSSNGGSTSSYIPDADSLIALGDLVDFAVSSLFTVALNSKQGRILYCEKDTNLINLAHRLYGLTIDDSTLESLAATNNIGLLELLQIKKGRKIIWFV